MTHKPPHAVIVDELPDVLNSRLPTGWCYRGQVTIELDTSVPEPDGAVVRGKKRDYLRRHPRATDVGLMIEVADTSLRRDRGVKKRIFARNRIPVYWIINLQERKIEVYSEPTGPARRPTYRQRRDYAENEEVPLILDGEEVARIPVRDLLP